MAIHSMTGFARVRSQTVAGELMLEVKSVNHRYLEMSLRQPEELRCSDIAVRQCVNKAINRGKVDVSMRLATRGEQAQPMQFDDAMLHRVAVAVEHISERLPQMGKVDPLALIRWPGILQEQALDDDEITAQVVATLEQALEQLQASRADEGARLLQIIEDRLQQVERCVEGVRERLPEQNRRWQEKLLERLKEVSEMEAERRDQALVQFAQRADVDEEIERIGSHIAEVRSALSKGSPIGRKLDFYMQEFNREANTLGSKSLDAEITKLAVELKVLIEQMREQVQNIE